MVLSQSTSKDQSEYTGVKSGTGVGYHLAHISGGQQGADGLGTDGMFKVLGRLEGTDMFAMMVVVEVVGHVDTAVEGTKCPMSNFLYFLPFWDLLLLSMPSLVSPTGVKGLKLLF